jgi:hypothetical protein
MYVSSKIYFEAKRTCLYLNIGWERVVAWLIVWERDVAWLTVGVWRDILYGVMWLICEVRGRGRGRRGSLGPRERDSLHCGA